MKFTIVIVCHNEAHAIEETINCALNQKFPKNEYEVLVVVNKSNDGTEELVDNLNVRRIFLEENYYVSALRNVAIKEAKGEFVFFIDGHMYLECNALQIASNWFENPQIAALCGTYHTPHNNLEGIRDIRYKAKARKYKLNKATIIDLDNFYTLTGGISAFRKEVLKEVEGYDFSFGYETCEDIHVQLKILNKGYRAVYDPSIKALHNHQHATIRSFMFRGLKREPYGLYKLIHRSIAENFRIPFDNYILRIPIITLGFIMSPLLLILSFNLLPICVFFVFMQYMEVKSFLKVSNRPLKLRVLALLYWIFINITRLIWLPLAFATPLIKFNGKVLIKGELKERSGELSKKEYKLEIKRGYVSRKRIFFGTINCICKLGFDALRKSPKWVKEL
ncbi:hypothetical protein CN447_28990 [Bacillus thuringiensis]|uniref:glycosyltransferase n=1 Tax=Bacillus TaxID=1386 RepID=UPI00027BFF81|nr:MULTISPECIES: glycosyltransferase [Bacillus]EJV74917.1 hypothetical protein IGE_05455 [Bacillus cereus HuB1-1]PEW81016.1 hypothetical protein CN447_28990 [Bacillus thuringiensis]PGS64238.1 hypothetical protein COD07_28000 [Bacillus thuringiensis]HDX9688675.1 glycosyltransferase [Bacillus thuringiensis]